jgi:hypothetical protein
LDCQNRLLNVELTPPRYRSNGSNTNVFAADAMDRQLNCRDQAEASEIAN